VAPRADQGRRWRDEFTVTSDRARSNDNEDELLANADGITSRGGEAVL
jgi:hypothetical protein